jgi:hypothetical protein
MIKSPPTREGRKKEKRIGRLRRVVLAPNRRRMFNPDGKTKKKKVLRCNLGSRQRESVKKEKKGMGNKNNGFAKKKLRTG